MDDLTEIMGEVRALGAHYPRRQLSAADYERWISDYAEDLRGCDAKDVRLACRVWRQGAHTRMATPGDLIALVRQYQPAPPARYLTNELLRSEYNEEHRRDMQAKLRELAEEIARNASLRGAINRRAGETATGQARRLWPSHEARL